MQLTIIPRTALVGGLLFVLAGTASANMLANPGFDEAGGSFNGWLHFENSYISLPEEPHRSAPASAKMFGNFTGGFNVTPILQVFPANEGEEYTMTGYSFVSSGDPMIGGGPPDRNWAVMKIAFFDAASGGNEIGGTDVIIATGLTPQDAWLFHTVSSVAPVGTQRVEALFLYLQPEGVFDGGACFVDDATFELTGPVSVESGTWGSIKALYR